MFHQIIHPKKKEDLLVHLPEEFLGKDVEVQANEFNGGEKSRKEKLDKLFKFLDTIKVDMSQFKFSRDEANER